MKKLVLQSTLNHKQSSYEPLTVEVEKVITLYGNEFHKLMRETLMDNLYIKNNRELMYFDGDTAHCVLFVDNGMLVEAQGDGYARESQFIPEARGISGQDSLIFETFDYDISFSTRTMAFDSSQGALFTPVICRCQRLSDCKDTACFYNMDVFEILPDDFIIQGIVRANNRLQKLFGKLATILSLAYISSSATISREAINLQIAGQRTVNFDIKLADINEDKKWQNIYTWIFTDGNPTDKALITHNVISLHCKFETLLNVNGTVFEAVKTNYNLYLRNNVNQYLDMKRDIGKFIQNIVAQVGDYAIAILGKFKTNLLAIFGFLFTVVLSKIGSTQKWEDIFSVDTIYLIELFVGGSLIYLIICIFETHYKFQKVKQGYEDLKRNYADILSESEIKEAFQDDKLLNGAEKSVKNGMIGWTLVWGGLLLISVIIIEAFTTNHGLMVWLWNKVF